MFEWEVFDPAIEGNRSVPSSSMAEGVNKRRWLRRLLVVAALVTAIAVLRDRQFARNEGRYGRPS